MATWWNNRKSRTKITLLINTLVGAFLLVSLGIAVSMIRAEWKYKTLGDIQHEFQEIRDEGIPKILEEMAEGEGKYTDGGNFYWKQDGKIRYRSGAFTLLKEPRRALVEIQVEGEEEKYIFTDVTQTQYGVIGYGKNVTDMIWMERNFMWAMGILWLLCIAASTVASSWMSNTILSPLRSMARKAEQINIKKLNMRIPLTGPKEDVMNRLGTTLNTMLKALKHEAQQIQEFNHDVSHELKTPLAVMQSELQLAQKKQDWKGVAAAVEEGKRLGILVEHMLFVASEPKKIQMRNLKKIKVKKIIEEAGNRCAVLYPEKNIIPMVEFGAQKFSFVANETLFTNLLQNLMENAYKYNRKDGMITVKVDEKGIQIQNTVPENYGTLPKNVLKPFVRGDGSRSVDGHGIGLSVAQKICELHGWKLHLGKMRGFVKVEVQF